MPQPATARYVARSNEDMVVSTGDLLKAMAGNEEITLVDARDRARFAGEVEPIDSAAGHIPGAINFPFVESLNADGTWLAADTLTEKWSSVLGPDSDVGWIAMCGSGVTACHLAISAELAGYAAPALYVGSWSEWIRDPARRLATGSG